jgi:phosphoribosylformylglycinamidine cyclo-ligase
MARNSARPPDNLIAMARLTYKAAGVDIELKERLIPLFRNLARPTLGAQVLGGVGGFGALVGLNGATKLRAPVLVAGADGVGTKLTIAFATGRHNTIGIDLVAMCVNDIICHNARPLFFLDYIGCGKLDYRVASAIVEGIARGCMLAGAGLVGGETAQMPGLYQKGEYDLAGFAVGIAERAKIPRPAALRAGDVIIGLASNGLHSSGFSLARKVLLERGRLRLNQRIAELGGALSDELLRPTVIYARLAAELFEQCAIKGLANITGGGIPENLPRIMPAGLHAEIRRGSWQIPPIFDLIQRIGRLEQAEMDRTFNNGVGMIAIVAARDTDRAMAFLKRRRASVVDAGIIGTLRRGARGVTFV